MTPSAEWLLLLHHLPPNPPYFRAKVLRRLQQIGALPLKNSAYLLPDDEERLEDFEWLAQEIQREGGSAWLFRAGTLAGRTDDEIRAAFRKLREHDFAELLQQADDISQLPHDEKPPALARLMKRFEELREIDFFDSPPRKQLEEAIRALHPAIDARREAAPRGRTWVTRQGIKVDRIGSAWLVLRFVDPDARFRFVDPQTYRHARGELRFDMFEGEYTHRGELCTFEVLLADHRLANDPALVAIGEMVHDIDLKEDRYRRAETPGLSRMIDGVCRRAAMDTERLELGGAVFNNLYESLRA